MEPNPMEVTMASAYRLPCSSSGSVTVQDTSKPSQQTLRALAGSLESVPSGMLQPASSQPQHPGRGHVGFEPASQTGFGRGAFSAFSSIGFGVSGLDFARGGFNAATRPLHFPDIRTPDAEGLLQGFRGSEEAQPMVQPALRSAFPANLRFQSANPSDHPAQAFRAVSDDSFVDSSCTRKKENMGTRKSATRLGSQFCIQIAQT